MLDDKLWFYAKAGAIVRCGMALRAVFHVTDSVRNRILLFVSSFWIWAK